MIVMVGVGHEDPVQRLEEEASRIGVETVLLDEAEAAGWGMELGSATGGLRAQATVRGRLIDLEAASGVYLRLTGPRRSGPAADELRRRRQQAAIALVCSWAEVSGARVANRPGAMASNASKPYQAALIRAHGFSVPATLVSNDPIAVHAFWAEHGRVVYKSTSGVRSIVHELTPARAARLDRVRHLPTQFQQLIEGTNIRAHVIGERVFACAISSATIDYRYAEGGAAPAMDAVELPTPVAERCRSLAAALELPLAGIDLLRDREGGWWCFEVNPSPAYTCFEEPTGLPMAAALACWLAGEGE